MRIRSQGRRRVLMYTLALHAEHAKAAARAEPQPRQARRRQVGARRSALLLPAVHGGRQGEPHHATRVGRVNHAIVPQARAGKPAAQRWTQGGERRRTWAPVRGRMIIKTRMLGAFVRCCTGLSLVWGVRSACVTRRFTAMARQQGLLATSLAAGCGARGRLRGAPSGSPTLSAPCPSAAVSPRHHLPPTGPLQRQQERAAFLTAVPQLAARPVSPATAAANHARGAPQLGCSAVRGVQPGGACSGLGWCLIRLVAEPCCMTRAVARSVDASHTHTLTLGAA